MAQTCAIYPPALSASHLEEGGSTRSASSKPKVVGSRLSANVILSRQYLLEDLISRYRRLPAKRLETIIRDRHGGTLPNHLGDSIKDSKDLDDKTIEEHLISTLKTKNLIIPTIGNRGGSERGFVDHREPIHKKVCIVGAGAAGLTAAMLLQFLNNDKAVNDRIKFEFDIYEASNRVGGRIYTHKFSNERHQYYDIGAMRLPDIAGMDATFKMIDYLNRQATEQRLPPPVPLDTYYMTAPKNTQEVPPPDYYKGSTKESISRVMDMLTILLDDYVQYLIDDFDKGFLRLVTDFNIERLSTRQFLLEQLPTLFPGLTPKEVFNKITLMETVFGGTGWFNQAFSETVLEWYDFKTVPEHGTRRSPTGWLRVDGGMERLIDAMVNPTYGGINRNKISLDSEVSEISYDKKKRKVLVTVTDTKTNERREPREYDLVLNSTTLGCLQRMNLVNLPDTITQHGKDQYTAIRCCQYDVSCKIAIQFSEAWWMTRMGVTYPGCVSGTDMSIRSVVYPSWVDEDDKEKPIVVIVSYNWGQDAVRMSSLIDNNNTSEHISEPLLRLVLQSLANLYSQDPNKSISVEQLRELCLKSHAYAWGNNPHTADAFAFFGPGQYSAMYPALQAPIAGTDGRMVLIGEAVSPHHAWISGAISSALTGLWTHMTAMAGEAKDEGKIDLEKAWMDAACALLKAPFAVNPNPIVNDDIQFDNKLEQQANEAGLFLTLQAAQAAIAKEEYNLLEGHQEEQEVD